MTVVQRPAAIGCSGLLSAGFPLLRTGGIDPLLPLRFEESCRPN